MKYTCENCNKGFDLPSYLKYTPSIYLPPYPYQQQTPSGWWPHTAAPSQTIVGTNYECNIPCCPFCYSKNIKETEK